MAETLFDCIRNGDVQRCKELLDNGAEGKRTDPNEINWDGQPILSLCIGYIHVRCTKKPDSERCMVCIKIMRCIELLIKYQADVNIQYHCQWTPLHKAVSTENISCIKMLLDSGADYNIPNKNGDTPKDFAIQLHNQDIIDLIESYEFPIKEPKYN